MVRVRVKIRVGVRVRVSVGVRVRVYGVVSWPLAPVEDDVAALAEPHAQDRSDVITILGVERREEQRVDLRHAGCGVMQGCGVAC